MKDHVLESYGDAFLIPLQMTLHRIVSFVPRLLVALVLLGLFYGLAEVIRRSLRRSLERFPHVPWAMRLLIARSAYFLMLLVGVLVALSAADINVTTVVASLGVAGFALGFALKDILENFISGFLLLFARPFEVGDQVTLGNFEGTVQDIQIRTTTLHTYSDEIVVIPNSSVYINPVINHTRFGRRRYQVDFDTSLHADADHVQQKVMQIVQEASNIAEDPSPFVRIRRVQSGIDVLSWSVYFWAAPQKMIEIQTTSEVLERIKRDLYDAGVPTPTSTSAMILRTDQAVSAPPEADHLVGHPLASPNPPSASVAEPVPVKRDSPAYRDGSASSPAS